RIGAGALLALSMLSKQNAGVEFVPVAMGICAIPELPRIRKAIAGIFQTGAGMLLVFAIFATWLWAYSSPAGFWHSYVELARQVGSDRIRLSRTLFGMLTLGDTLDRSIVPLLILGVALGKSRSAAIRIPNAALITWLAIACLFFQSLFKLHTYNEVENCLPYLGLVYGLSLGLFLEVYWKWGSYQEKEAAVNWPRTLLYAGAGCVIFGLPFRD